MSGVSSFDINKVLFRTYLPCQLKQMVEIWQMDSVRVLNVPFSALDFSCSQQPLPLLPPVLKMWFFMGFSYFHSLFPKYLPSKLNWEVKTLCVDLVAVFDVPSGVFKPGFNPKNS